MSISRRKFIATAATAGCAVLARRHVIAAPPQNSSVATTEVTDGDTILLSGTDWWIHRDPTGTGLSSGFLSATIPAAGWIPANVPGNIQADVENAHQLSPLWYGATDANLYKVAEEDWWYRKDFVVPATYSGKRITLDFEGVDEYCKVWLNGTLLGENRGMFRRFCFDVTGVARPGRANQLAIWVARMPDELVPYLVNSDGLGEKDPFGPYGFMTGVNNTRKVLKDLKTPGNFSYDWSFNVWTLGIWKDTRLEATGPVRILWCRVESELTNNFTGAIVTATIEVDSSADTPVEADVEISGFGAAISQRVEAKLTKGRNFISVRIPIDQPALWWPNGFGAQPLYELHANVVVEGKVSDVQSARFGIREIRWVPTEGAPADFICRYQMVLNGQKIRTIGSGLIEPGVLPGCVSDRNLGLLHHAKACGMNTFRINGGGGGPLFDERWYDLADELGIMIQYEFPIGNCIPETDDVFLSNLEMTCSSIIRQSRNHPSIIEYVGGNEMNWHSDSKHPALLLMRKLVTEESDRHFRATSPDLGDKHAPWDFDILGSDNGGYKGSYKHFNDPFYSTADRHIEAMSYSEFGASSPAHEEVWHRDVPLASQWPLTNPDDPVLIRGNALHAVFGPEHWLSKSRIDAVFGPPNNLRNLIAAGQYLGADGLRYIFDALRRRGPRLGNITNHCFGDPWPNLAGCALVDYAGRPKMNYDFVKQALSPISLSLKFDGAFYDSAAGVNAELWVVSDAPNPAVGLRWQWVARDRLGTIFAHDKGTADIRPLEVKKLGTMALKLPDKDAVGIIFVELRLTASDGNLLTERIEIFGDKDREGPFKGLLDNRGGLDETADEALQEKTNSALVPNGGKTAIVSLSRPDQPRAQGGGDAGSVCRTTLTVECSSQQVVNGQEVIELHVHNTGQMTALFAEPHPLLVYRTDLFIENRNCFIPPGESRVITIRASDHPEDGLSLAQTGWLLSCWNADDVQTPPSDDVILSVGRQDEMCREFANYFKQNQAQPGRTILCQGNRPVPAELPHLLDGDSTVRFEFTCSSQQAARAARLRIHTADQSAAVQTLVQVSMNGKTIEKTLPQGLGIQRTDPAHLAFPATVEFDLRPSNLHRGKNVLVIHIMGDGWFTWDSLDLVSKS